MTIRFDAPPADGMSLVATMIHRVLHSMPPSTSFFVASHTQEIQIAHPHAVFDVGLTDVADGSLCRAARRVGWRYLLFERDCCRMAAELAHSDQGPSFSSFYEGPLAPLSLELLQRAETAAEASNIECTARLVRCPLLKFEALWLHGASDTLYPLLAGHGFTAGQAYSEHDAIGMMQQAAQDLTTASPNEAV